jgi:DNA-directed RNA polymerase
MKNKIHIANYSTTLDSGDSSNFNEGKSKKVLKSFSSGYNAIENIITSDDTLYNKQLKIEETIRHLWRVEIEDILSKKSFLGNDSLGLRILVGEIKNLKDDIHKFINDPVFTKHKPYFKIIKTMDPTLILSILLGKAIPFSVRYKDSDEQPIHSLFKDLGDALLREVGLEYYNNDLKAGKITKDINLSEYCSINNLILDEEELIKLGCDLVVILSNNSNLIELKEIKVSKNLSKRIILARDGLKNLLDNITLVDSEELPMLIKPLAWRINTEGVITEYGGSLLNNKYRFKSLRSKSFENIKGNNIKLSNLVIDAVNKIASVEYSINTELLDIVTSNEYFKGKSPLVYLEPHSETSMLSTFIEDKNYIKVNEITSHNSKHLYDSSIISVARLMSKVEGFYVTVFIDWRGRFYSSNSCLNIQGGELARSLLLFRDGEVLNEKGLKSLKIYTANAFGKSKLSKLDRLSWADEHLDEILNTPNNNLWLKADEPLLFLACALELKGYYNNPLSFVSRLPILMDATCNGLQHLSAMAQDITLAERVNLLASDESTKPNDVYSDLIIPIKQGIDDLVKKYVEHFNLSKLNITRKLIKRGIMTITYGVTPRGILNQLLSEQFIKFDVVDNHNLYKPTNSEVGENVVLRFNDIVKLSEIIYHSLFKIHPSLNSIMKYFHAMVKLLNDLNLPVRWLTPSGLVLEQQYVKFTKYDITNSVLKKRYKIVLRKPAQKNKKSVINTLKQINSFVPNFIHSMDGSNIVLLIQRINKYPMNIATIHDCFATQANHADLLAHLVKESFISIYGNNEFIDKFHSYILYTIENTYQIVDNHAVINDKEDMVKLPIPDKPILGSIELATELRRSQYFIN